MPTIKHIIINYVLCYEIKIQANEKDETLYRY
jgi:hypothetical protein